MYRIVHVMIGLATGLFIGGSSIYSLLYGISCALGSYFPDIKHPHGYRGKLSHNIVLPSLLILLTYSIHGLTIINIGNPVLLSVSKIIIKTIYVFLIGWLLHVFADSLSIGGVYFFWPISSKRIGFTSLKSNSLLLNMIGLFIAFMIFYAWLVVSGLNKYLEEIIKILFHSFS